MQLDELQLFTLWLSFAPSQALGSAVCSAPALASVVENTLVLSRLAKVWGRFASVHREPKVMMCEKTALIIIIRNVLVNVLLLTFSGRGETALASVVRAFKHSRGLDL